MSPRKAALAFCALLVAAALPASSALDTPTHPYLVFGPVAGGERVLDDYGAFHSADLTDAQVGALQANGIGVERLDRTFHRGAWSIAGSDAAVPAAQRADPTNSFSVVQYRGPVMAAWFDTLKTSVERVYDSVPSYAYVVKATPAQLQRLAAMPEVAFVGAYHPAYKLAPELPPSGSVDVAILTFPGEDIAFATEAVLQNGGTLRSATTSFPLDGIVKASVPAENLAAIARVPAVSWIEPAYDGITLDNAQASAITQTGQLGNWRLYDKGVDGSSQKLSICDTGVNTVVPVVPGINRMTHEMDDDANAPAVVWMVQLPDAVNLHRKVFMYYAPLNFNPAAPAVAGNPIGGDMDDTDSHGTHTSGTLTGDAPPYGVRNGNDGVAYAAKLVVCDITNQQGTFYIANDYSQYWDPAYAAGARVNSNSWGSPHVTTYTEKARQHDAYVATHRDFVIARSMGNTGGNTIRPEAIAKSALGVGATQNGAGMENLASFSSRGPTQDGRIKPNVDAPGDALISAGTGANDYVALSGTSMSTPVVSASAGLIRDYFAKGFYPSGSVNAADALNPSSALVRGLLEVSGKRITGASSGTGFPNNDQGWGRVLLDDALYFAGDARQLFVKDEDAGLNTGEVATFSVSVAAGQPLKVMLTWSDAPGAAGANPAIVNDLDLEVTGPAGTYKGNVFSNGESQANSGTRDTRNVDEAVIVGAPAAGTYTITVRGTNVPSGPQTFALAATHA